MLHDMLSFPSQRQIRKINRRIEIRAYQETIEILQHEAGKSGLLLQPLICIRPEHILDRV